MDRQRTKSAFVGFFFLLLPSASSASSCAFRFATSCSQAPTSKKTLLIRFIRSYSDKCDGSRPSIAVKRPVLALNLAAYTPAGFDDPPAAKLGSKYAKSGSIPSNVGLDIGCAGVAAVAKGAEELLSAAADVEACGSNGFAQVVSCVFEL